MLKWWHNAPDGGVGIGERTHASDPHLWLPYVTLRYVAATGDATVLHEKVGFVEGAPVPSGVEGHVISPTPAPEIATVLDHCRRAIDHTLSHFGAHGLPLMGAGDWDDGMNLVGFRGRGESVWMGFFLYDNLTRFAELLRGEKQESLANSLCRARRRAARRARRLLARQPFCARLLRRRRGVFGGRRDVVGLAGAVGRGAGRARPAGAGACARTNSTRATACCW